MELPQRYYRDFAVMARLKRCRPFGGRGRDSLKNERTVIASSQTVITVESDRRPRLSRPVEEANAFFGSENLDWPPDMVVNGGDKMAGVLALPGQWRHHAQSQCLSSDLFKLKRRCVCHLICPTNIPELIAGYRQPKATWAMGWLENIAFACFL
jgi:hypothetical protein